MANIKQKLEEGWIQCRVVIELVGKPKEHVEAMMKKLAGKVREEKGMEVIDEHIAEIKKQDTGSEEQGTMKELWVTFGEFEILFKDLVAITYFCFEYMPSSFEILEPQELNVPAFRLTEFFNDLQLRLHQLDMAVKQMKNKNDFMENNIQRLLNNFVLVLLQGRELTSEQLARLTGTSKDIMEDFLDKLADENKVEMEGEKYRRVTDGGKKSG